MKALNKMRIHVRKLPRDVSIALEFIPILMEETDKISSQMWGADFENGNLIQKAKNLLPLLVPLFISAFRRADDLAMAMEARCYHGGENRTSMKPLRYHSRDVSAYVCIFLYLAADIVIRVLV